VALAAPAAGAQQASGKHPAAASALDPGAVENGVYRNPLLGFECSVPAGWVLQTAQMANDQARAGNVVLLSAFERAPHSAGAGVNSSIVIAAESQSSDPDVDTPLGYLVLLKEAAHQGGLELAEPPRETRVAQRMLWRADFASDPEASPGLSRYQISEVMLARGYFVSFTFIADTQQDAETLLSNLHFSMQRSARPQR
jgi:hypothetical protein